MLFPNRSYALLPFHSIDDLINLQDKYPFKEFEDDTPIPAGMFSVFAAIDWVEVSKDYDALHLTRTGQVLTRYSRPSLYGWIQNQ